MFPPQVSCLLASQPLQGWRDAVGNTATLRLRERPVPHSSSPPAPLPHPPPLPHSMDTGTPHPEFPALLPLHQGWGPFSSQRQQVAGDMIIRQTPEAFEGGFPSTHSPTLLVGHPTDWKAANLYLQILWQEICLPPSFPLLLLWISSVCRGHLTFVCCHLSWTLRHLFNVEQFKSMVAHQLKG